MTPAREDEILTQIASLTSVAGAHVFRKGLPDKPTTAVYAALLAKIDDLHKRGL